MEKAQRQNKQRQFQSTFTTLFTPGVWKMNTRGFHTYSAKNIATAKTAFLRNFAK